MRKFFQLVALASSPILLFVFVYSWGAGCFICLYGNDSGGPLEAAINILLAMSVIAGLIALFWKDSTRTD